MVVMLQVGEFFTELVQVMVVQQCDCAQDLLVCIPFVADELLADHVPDELGAVGVLAEFTQLLQPLEQGLFYGKTQSG